MLCVAFVTSVLLSALYTYARRERAYRPRWQSLERPAVVTGMGAYRSALTVPGRVEAAPWPLRVMAFTCIAFGRGVSWSLLVTVVGAATAAPGLRPVAAVTLHAMLGYFSAGFGVGTLATLVLASLVLGVGNDLLVRDHRGAFHRARAVALASLAVHGVVALHATWPRLLVGVAGRDAGVSLGVARAVACVGFAHAAVLLAMAYAYRAQLTAMSSAARSLER